MPTTSASSSWFAAPWAPGRMKSDGPVSLLYYLERRQQREQRGLDRSPFSLLPPVHLPADTANLKVGADRLAAVRRAKGHPRRVRDARADASNTGVRHGDHHGPVMAGLRVR